MEPVELFAVGKGFSYLKKAGKIIKWIGHEETFLISGMDFPCMESITRFYP
ncbi:hypothetical protein H8R04_15030 [Clostridium perfringens]|nr:hypothetical protein [Clostridium perfringens]